MVLKKMDPVLHSAHFIKRGEAVVKQLPLLCVSFRCEWHVTARRTGSPNNTCAAGRESEEWDCEEATERSVARRSWIAPRDLCARAVAAVIF